MDDDSYNNEKSPHQVHPNRKYRRSPGRQYGYDYDPLRTQSSNTEQSRKKSDTGKLISRFVEQNRLPAGSPTSPLVRRAPYLYDDGLREEIAQQVDRPIMRRSSSLQFQDEEEEVVYPDANPAIPRRASRVVQSATGYEADYYEAGYKEASPAKPELTLEIVKTDVSPIPLLNHYRRKVLQQANQSFVLALIAAVIGLIFYIAAVSFLVLRQPTSISFTSLISGSLVEVIAGINFYLYGRTSRQLATFHMYLDRSCRFEASIGACEAITSKELRDQTRSNLIQEYMRMPQIDFVIPKSEDSKNNS